jgi:mannose-6-phosphate isomerase-like protein (cupin superfamily)
LTAHGREREAEIITPSKETLAYEDVKAPLLIEKPWGEETLVGLHNRIELWELLIRPGDSTSYHSHPNKETLLVVIHGEALLRTEEGEETLRSGDFRLIERKACHQIRCSGKVPLLLHEIESPADKNDLVRIEDDYQREGRAYLYKSHVIAGGQLIRLALTDRKSALEYLREQNRRGTPESELPVDLATDFGMKRALYRSTTIPDGNGGVEPGRVTVYEAFVPSLEHIERAMKAPRDEHDRFVITLDQVSRSGSNGRLRGNSRAVRENIWNELSIVLSGELTFVQFEIASGEPFPSEVSSLGEIENGNFEDLVVERLGAGDAFFSRAGSASGIFDASDAFYLTFLSGLPSINSIGAI